MAEIGELGGAKPAEFLFTAEDGQGLSELGGMRGLCTSESQVLTHSQVILCASTVPLSHVTTYVTWCTWCQPIESGPHSVYYTLVPVLSRSVPTWFQPIEAANVPGIWDGPSVMGNCRASPTGFRSRPRGKPSSDLQSRNPEIRRARSS